MSTFNMGDVNVKQCESLMGTPTLKSNIGDQKVCKKMNLSWLFGVYRKIRPSGSLFGITRQSPVTRLAKKPEILICPMMA